MPTINKRFLLRLLLGVAVAVGLVAGVHAVQARRIPAALLAQADHAAEAGKPDAAVNYLRQYLEFRPADTDALARLAASLRERSRPGEATFDAVLKGEAAADRNFQERAAAVLMLYDKVLRADPGREAVRTDAVAVALKIGRYSDAAAHADALLQTRPTDAAQWGHKGDALAGLQKSAEARKCFEQAVAHAPGDFKPYQRLAQYLLRDIQNPAEAKAVIDRMVVACPTSAEAFLTRARFDKLAGDGPTADADLKRVLELDPTSAEGHLLTAERQQKARRLADARDTLAAGLKHHPTDARLIRALAWLELNRGNLGAAVACLEDGLDKVPDGTDLLVPLADLLVDLGEVKRATEIVGRLDAKASPLAKLQSKYLTARLAMRAGEWAAACRSFTELRAESAYLPGLEAQSTLLLAVCLQRRGDTAAEHDALRTLLNKDPNHLTARTTLGLSLLNNGRPAEAIREYEQAVRNPMSGPGVHATLLRLKARGYARSGRGDWSQLDRVAREVEKFYPVGSSEPAMLQADLLAARGEYAKAAAKLVEASTRRPGDRRLWAARTEMVVNVAGVAAGLGVLDEAQAVAGDGPEVRLARADLTARDPAKLRPIDPLFEQTDTWPENDQVRLLYGLLEVCDRLGDDARAVATCQKIAARRPADVAVWLTLAERATVVGDTKAADEATAAAGKLDPSGKPAALLAAWRATRGEGDVTAATAGLTATFGANPDSGDACLALGRLMLKAGDAAGIRMLDRATRLEPSRFAPMTAFLAATADQAAATLDRLSRDHRWAGEPFRRSVAAAARTLPPANAAKLLAAARPFVADEPGGLGWLSDSYLACGLKPESLAVCEEATARPAATADDWLRLAVRTAEAGGDPGKVFAQAKEKVQPGLYFAAVASFAECAAAPKGWEPPLAADADKRGFTQARLAVQLSRFQRAAGVLLLTKFLNTNPPPADAMWAKRNKAMLLAVGGGTNDRQNAMTLLAETTDVPGETADEKRSSAAVLTALSRHLDGRDRTGALERATRLLTQLVDETKSARDAFLLAQLHRASGDRVASVAVLQKMLQADPTNLDYLTMALDELTERGDFAAAAPFAQRLLNLYPTEFRAVSVAARFEAKAGKPDKALALAEGYVRTADANAGDLPQRMARTAELLDELARMPAVRGTEAGKAMVKSAVEKYAELAVGRPEAVVAAAGLLAVDGRPADAFALVEKQPSLPAPLRAAAGLAVVRPGGSSDRQRETVARWLTEAAAEQPGAASVQVNRGEFLALTGDYPGAEVAYRAALKIDPRNVVALNNLAWVIGPEPDRAAEALDLVARAVAEVGLTAELLDTRARVRISARKLDLAEKDLTDALLQEKTPQRLFHLALLHASATPAKTAAARDAFRQAKQKGLQPGGVHPADLPAYRAMDAN